MFGLCNEDEYNECVLQSKTLPSFVVNRVANGNQRRVGSTSGEFYAELKVYARHDAEEAPKDTRWTKALLRLNCYLEEGSPQWKLLHRFVKEAGTLFEDCVPSFYNPDLVKIKQADWGNFTIYFHIFIFPIGYLYVVLNIILVLV